MNDERIGAFCYGWELVHREREWGAIPDPRVWAFIWREFSHLSAEQRPLTQIIDLGCGTGGNAVHLATQLFTVYAVDASPSALSRAREMMPALLEPLLHYRNCEVTQIPALDGAFDAAIDVRCFECLTAEDCRRAVREAHRILKPGGWLFSMSPTEECPEPANAGPPSRKMSRADVEDIYGSVFPGCAIRAEGHFDGTGQRQMLWIIEACKAA